MKKSISLLLILVLLLALSVPAFAESQNGQDGLTVTYTSAGKLVSSTDFSTALADLQPGDDVTILITVKNENSEITDWYIKNTVKESLEDKSNASEGAYSYTLNYSGRSIPLYDSEAVGGKDVSAAGEGLHEIDSAMKDYIYLDTLKPGQTATVTLKVTLDGESQLNVYNSTQAELRLRFAVEKRDPKNIKTGDEMPFLPMLIVMIVSGTLLLGLAVIGLRGRRRAIREGRR